MVLARNTKSRALSAFDAAFIYAESCRTPMHMASLGLFEAGGLLDGEGRLRRAELVGLINSRLDLVPKLRQRLAMLSVGVNLPPRWVDDPEFSVERHVCEIVLDEPVDEMGLLARCAELIAVPLERNHPLWKFYVFPNYSEGHVAVLVLIHHALADGLAGVEIATLLFDIGGGDGLKGDGEEWRPGGGPGLVGQIVERGRVLGEVGLGLAKRVGWGVVHPGDALAAGWAVLEEVGSVLTPKLVAPRLGMNVAVGQKRKLALVRVPLAGLAAVAHAHEATINDCLLTAVAGGICELLIGREISCERREVTLLVPVGTEHSRAGGAGNDVSAMMVRVPLGESDVGLRLAAVTGATKQDKARHQALGVSTLLSVLEIMPQRLIGVAARSMHRQPVLNVVVTNVPGPGVQLYALGARLLEAFPVVPLAGNLPIGVAALSYGGQLGMGVLVDPVAVPDLDVLVEGIEDTFAQLLTLH